MTTKNNPWFLALYRMLEPNEDPDAETCEWIIALIALAFVFMCGFIFGKLAA